MYRGETVWMAYIEIPETKCDDDDKYIKRERGRKERV